MSDEAITSAAESNGFDLDDILDNVVMSENTVTVYLDPVAGERAGELSRAIEDAASSPTPAVTGITDESPTQKMQEELQKYKDQSITFRLRALSSAELTAAKQRIVATVRIDKKLPEDEKAEAEAARVEALYEQFLSRAIIKSTYAKTGAEKNHYSPDDVSKLRFRLDSHEWEKLKDAFNVTLVRAEAVETMMSDPTFRGADADEGK